MRPEGRPEGTSTSDPEQCSQPECQRIGVEEASPQENRREVRYVRAGAVQAASDARVVKTASSRESGDNGSPEGTKGLEMKDVSDRGLAKCNKKSGS